MTDFLYNIDLNVFYFINHTLANPFFDKFFTFITEVKHWYLAYIVLWLILFIKGGRIGKITAVAVLIAITFSDQLSSHLLKDWIGRIRPCNALPDVRLIVSSTNSFSFPSSHAVNNFTIAVLMLRIFPKYKWLLLTVASLVVLSRPYVGVHYPSDILGGAIIGSLVGYIFSLLVKTADNYFEKRTINNKGNIE